MTGNPSSPAFDLEFPEPVEHLSDLDYIPESPLYRPRKRFFSLESSKLCSPETLLVLEGMGELLEHVLPTANGLYPKRLFISTVNWLYERMLFVPAERDHIYESCRLTNLIVLNAIMKSQQLAEADCSITSKLAKTLGHTDVTSNWSDMLGVLYWIALVGTAATIGKPEFVYMSSILGSATFELCYTTKDPRTAIRPVQVFSRLHSLIRSGVLFTEDSPNMRDKRFEPNI